MAGVRVPCWPPPPCMQHRPPGLNVPPLHVLCTLRCDDHPICLNQESCSDLAWWCELFHRWDGLSFFLMPEWAPIPDFKFLLMPPALWAMEPSSSTSGSAVHGQHHSNPCLLRTGSSFPLLWLHTYGVLSGLLGGSSSCVTMSRWWLFCLLVPSGTLN